MIRVRSKPSLAPWLDIRDKAPEPQGPAERFTPTDLWLIDKKLRPSSKVSLCGQYKKKGASRAQIVVGDGAPFISGMQRCGQRTCPICAVGLRGAQEVAIGQKLSMHLAGGGQAALVTLTAGTGRRRLATLLKLLIETAKAHVKGAGKGWRTLGIQGWVRAIEATHSTNGWHPHIHLLMFLAPHADLDQIDACLREGWTHQARRLGLGRVHGIYGVLTQHVGCDDAGTVARYVAKGAWGPSSRDGHRSPVQLLAAAATGDRAAGILWREFTEAIPNRHLIRWSQGWKPQVAPADATPTSPPQVVADIGSDLRAALAETGETRTFGRAVRRGGLSGGIECARGLGLPVRLDTTGPAPVLRLLVHDPGVVRQPLPGDPRSAAGPGTRPAGLDGLPPGMRRALPGAVQTVNASAGDIGHDAGGGS